MTQHTRLERIAYGHAASQALCFEDVFDDWYEAYVRLCNSVENNQPPSELSVWEPLENWDRSDVLEHIETEAESLLITIRHVLDQAKEGVVHSAINCTLDSDMNCLDLEDLIESAV